MYPLNFGRDNTYAIFYINNQNPRYQVLYHNIDIKILPSPTSDMELVHAQKQVSKQPSGKR